MAAQTRVYLVTTDQGKQEHLVRASHPSHAMMHIARDFINVRVASQDDLIEAIKNGAAVRDIKAEQHELPT